MLLYHGTTRRSAEQIAVEGFAPRKPSRRVWFAHSKGYALRRAKVKARRRHDRPVVLQCELDLATLRRKAGQQACGVPGGHRFDQRQPAGDGAAPRTRGMGSAILGTGAGRMVERPAWPQGASRRESQRSGLIRLARWIRNRRTSQPYSRLRDSEIVERAASWLPQWFRGVSVATRGYGRPRWPDLARLEEPKPLTGVHGDCAIRRRGAPCGCARAGALRPAPPSPVVRVGALRPAAADCGTGAQAHGPSRLPPAAAALALRRRHHGNPSWSRRHLALRPWTRPLRSGRRGG